MSLKTPPLTSDTDVSRSSRVRERLLDAAGRLFYAEGFRAVGIDRILAEAEVAKASLYAHFDSKDELIAAYLEARAAEGQAAIQAELARVGGDARTRLLALFDIGLRSCETSGFRGCAFQIAAAELPDASHPGVQVMLLHRAWMRQLIIDLVREAAPGAPDTLACAVTALHDGAAAQVPTGTGREAMEGARWAVETLIPPAVLR